MTTAATAVMRNNMVLIVFTALLNTICTISSCFLMLLMRFNSMLWLDTACHIYMLYAFGVYKY